MLDHPIDTIGSGFLSLSYRTVSHLLHPAELAPRSEKARDTVTPRGSYRRYVLESPPSAALVPLNGVGGPTHEYDILPVDAVCPRYTGCATCFGVACKNGPRAV